MIRKFCAIIILAFTSLWFMLAYTIKNKVVNLLNDVRSDNIGLNYENISVSGFPTKWNVSVYNPRMTFVTPFTSHELTTKEINLTVNIKMDSINIKFDKNFSYINAKNEEKSELYFRSTTPLDFDVHFANYYSLFSDNISKQIDSLIFKNSLIDVLDKNQNNLFNISNVNLVTNKYKDTDEEKISLILSGSYKNNNKNWNTPDTKLDLDIDYISFVNKKAHPDKTIIVKNTKFIIGDAELLLNGSLNFSKNTPPLGVISLGIKNHQDIINNLFSNNSLISRMIVQQISDKAELLHDDEEIKLDLSFSKDGISIDDVQILELGNDSENNRGI